MHFHLPEYRHPDFSILKDAPDAKIAIVEADGVAPENFHSTSMFPEYFKIDGQWILAAESRMDSSVVVGENNVLSVVENRNGSPEDDQNLQEICIPRSNEAFEGNNYSKVGCFNRNTTSGKDDDPVSDD